MDYAAKTIIYFGIVWSSSLVVGEEVNLTDTRLATTDLNWKTFPSDGSGWNEVSNSDKNGFLYRSFQVCDTRSPGQVNWFVTNYIPLEKGIHSVFVDIMFYIKSCQDLPNAATCKETFNLYVLETNSSNDDGMTEVPDKRFLKVDTIAADQRMEAKENEASIVTRRIDSVRSNGMYLAFQDTGGCMIIYYVRVYHKRCRAAVQNLAEFPTTMTGGKRASLMRATGKCVRNAVWMGNSRGPGLHCNSEGKWQVPDGSCKCLPGFQPNLDLTECVACKIYSYKSGNGNHKCSRCPSYSSTNVRGSAECHCNDGYYRAPGDMRSAPCSKPPSKPEMIQYVVKDTKIVMNWSAPRNKGGRNDILYRITCSRCDSKNIVCSDCGNDVTYLPNASALIQPEVSISGLAPHTYYRFKVSSFNGVSAISGQTPAFAEASVKTSESVPSAVETIRVVRITDTIVSLSWDVPSNTNGDIQEYEVHAFSKSGDISLISRSVRTKITTVDIEHLPPRAKLFVEVRARNVAGYGPFSNQIQITTKVKEPKLPWRPKTEDISQRENSFNSGRTNSPSKKTSRDYLVTAVVVSIVSVLIIAVIVASFVIRVRRNSKEAIGCEDVEVFPFFDYAAARYGRTDLWDWSIV